MKKQEQLHKIRYSVAHLLAMTMVAYDKNVKIGEGAVTEDGFYYDFKFSDGKTPSPALLKKFKKSIRSRIKQGLTFETTKVTNPQATEMFKDEPYKLEIIHKLKQKEITTHTINGFTDISDNTPVSNTKDIDPNAFTLTHIAGAYWQGDKNRPMLTRIYGIVFNTEDELKQNIAQKEEAKLRDHKKLGKELDLFTFSDVVGKGLPLWTEKGATIRRVLERFIVDEEIKRGYKHVITPDIASIELYKKSGHYPYYKDSMYSPIVIDDEQFMLRPMSCPHHYELYLRKPHSYKELPIRMAEVAKLYRYEQSGELSGLIRARSFSLADSHIICADKEQAKTEIAKALDLIEYISKVFGLKIGKNYWYSLSLGDRLNEKKYYKDDDAWNASEKTLREVLTERKSDFVEEKDEAAFYGPKIDIQMRNVNGKEDTAFTVQYDFVGAKQFNLTYIDKENKEKQCIIIHRSSIGAIERIIAFLIEHYGGAFPVWLAPVQIKILPIGENHKEYAREVFSILKNTNIRAELDDSNESLGKKIRITKLEKVPYFIVIGDNECTTKKTMVESRDDGKIGEKTTDELINILQKKP